MKKILTLIATTLLLAACQPRMTTLEITGIEEFDTVGDIFAEQP